jgi:hypothetical protein
MRSFIVFSCIFSLPGAFASETFNNLDLVNCYTSNGLLVGQIQSMRSETAAEVAWMNGDGMSSDFNLKRSCVNITNWANDSEKKI